MSNSASAAALLNTTAQQKRRVAAWVGPVARIGFASIAVVYMTIGFLALLLALGKGGQAIDQRGAMDAVQRLPAGNVILVGLASGMAGYACWRLLQGFMDLQEKGTKPKALLLRLGYIGSGVAYAFLGVSALKIVFGRPDYSDPGKGFSAWLLSHQFGAVVLGAIGLAVAGWGVAHFVRAHKEKFMKYVNTREMSPGEQRWMRRVGKLGLGARGTVLLTLGFLGVNAARHHNPGQVQGFDGALRELALQPYGTFILGVVAVGLIAYGVYWGFNTRYRRIWAAED